MRKQFKEYVCLRPIRSYDGIETLITNKAPIDMVIIRENSEGEYVGAGGFAHINFSNELAVQTTVMTREGVERIARYAFELARKRRKHVTSVTKSNALQYTQVFWDKVVEEVAQEYPDVKFDWIYADTATMRFVQNPAFFDVIVTTNLFGDLLIRFCGKKLQAKKTQVADRILFSEHLLAYIIALSIFVWTINRCSQHRKSM